MSSNVVTSAGNRPDDIHAFIKGSHLKLALTGSHMSDISSMSMFINMQERQKLSRRIQNVVESLLAALHIDPAGRQLIMACGTGDERNNREALIAWMRKAICCEQRLDTFSTEQIANELQRHLERSLGTWCD